jgi:hypothetical protein
MLKLEEDKSGLVAPAGQMVSNIQALAQVNAQITERQTTPAALLLRETEQNPDVLHLCEEIRSLQSQATQMAQVPGLQLEYIR